MGSLRRSVPVVKTGVTFPDHVGTGALARPAAQVYRAAAPATDQCRQLQERRRLRQVMNINGWSDSVIECARAPEGVDG